jgi:succinate dehydrogenase / fumarate reductase flavoprotein subunit
MSDADVVVIGSGGAGLRAALAAHQRGARVLVLTKGRLESSGVTATACSDRMAFHATLEHTDPGGPDAWRYHAEDIYRIGGEVSDGPLARVLAQGAAEAFHFLERLGVPFVRGPDGRVLQFVTDGSRYARACYTGPHTANHIHEALRGEVQRRGIAVLENAMAADLALDARGRVAGVHLVDGRTIGTAAVVLATGGAGQAYAVNVFPDGMTGDGYAMAYRAGADLVNLEFIQIGLSNPPTRLACSGSLMRAWPRLVDERGREFLFDHFPAGTPPEEVWALLFRKGAAWPVSREEPTHAIDVAVFSEIARGRRVALDFSRNPAGLDLARMDPALWADHENLRHLRLTEPPLEGSPLARLSAINRPIVEWLRERGIDLAAGDHLEIAPACQHFQGGVRIDTRAATTVPGLFAAGEAAGGQHGANRPGGNALLDGQVFGRIAGNSAAELALASKPGPPVAPPPPHEADGKPVDVREVRDRVRRLLSARASVKRTTAGLAEALAELAELVQRRWDAAGADPVLAAETRNLALVAEMVLRAAAARDESRGPHLRFASDDATAPLPRRDPDWRKCLLIRRGADGGMALRAVRPAEPDWERVPPAGA